MRHFITNKNIIDPAVENNIQKNFPNGLDFCYTDPPWGSGNLKYWKTINKKATNLDSDLIDQFQLEDRVVDLITKYVNNYAFIVYGVHQAKSIIEKLQSKANVKDVQYYEKTYANNLKNCIICVTLNDNEILDFSDLQKTKGLKSLKIICEMFKDKYKNVLELFVGIGYYLKVLDKYGFVVAGNELNSSRLSKALNKIK